MSLQLYNTLTRKKEEFKPLKDGAIKWYTCGPTVYDFCHLGHAKGYVSMDVIRRYLEWSGYKVKYVQNFTDVGHLTDNDNEAGEDKIEKRAKEKHVDPMSLVEEYINAYYEDFHALNVTDPDVAPRPTQEIKEIIEFVQGLIDKGVAYESNGSVYFDVNKFEDYGNLSGQKIDELKTGARVEVREEKRNPLDFALWIKADPEHILKYESPWSVGYPGWHIECSVMAKKYLGETIDIHAGGNENIFPHNESEIAQSEALNGKTFANYWLHWNMVKIDGVKMSKSKNNFTTIRELLKKYDPMVVRLAIIKSHYRSPVEFNEKAFEDAKKNLNEIRNTIITLKNVSSQKENSIDVMEWAKKIKGDFVEPMNDDFNTPWAFSNFLGWVGIINKDLGRINKEQAREVLDVLYSIDKVLGLKLEDAEEETIPENVQELAEDREKARKEKNFELSDKIRVQIEELGYTVEDTEKGTQIRKK